MAFLKVTIDDETVIDGDTGTWIEQPPEFIAKQMDAALKSDVKPSPWMRALMLVVAETAMTDTATAVDVKTWDEGWSLTTNYDVKYSVKRALEAVE